MKIRGENAFGLECVYAFVFAHRDWDDGDAYVAFDLEEAKEYAAGFENEVKTGEFVSSGIVRVSANRIEVLDDYHNNLRFNKNRPWAYSLLEKILGNRIVLDYKRD